MGNCCSNDDDDNHRAYLEKQYQLQQQQQLLDVQQQTPGAINYGPLPRDADNLPNLIAFGTSVQLYEDNDNPQDEIVHDGQQYLMQSRVQAPEPLERSIKAVISSPDRTNRVRTVHQVQDGNYVSEPLSDVLRDSRSMELNKNLKTPPISNSLYRGVQANQTKERQFYNNATATTANGQSNQKAVPNGSSLQLSQYSNYASRLVNSNNVNNNPSSQLQQQQDLLAQQQQQLQQQQALALVQQQQQQQQQQQLQYSTVVNTYNNANSSVRKSAQLQGGQAAGTYNTTSQNGSNLPIAKALNFN